MMTVCNWCNQEMKKADDCTGNRAIYFGGGKRLPSIPYTADDENQRCHDCNVKVAATITPDATWSDARNAVDN